MSATNRSSGPWHIQKTLCLYYSHKDKKCANRSCPVFQSIYINYKECKYKINLRDKVAVQWHKSNVKHCQAIREYIEKYNSEYPYPFGDNNVIKPNYENFAQCLIYLYIQKRKIMKSDFEEVDSYFDWKNKSSELRQALYNMSYFNVRGYDQKLRNKVLQDKVYLKLDECLSYVNSTELKISKSNSLMMCLRMLVDVRAIQRYNSVDEALKKGKVSFQEDFQNIIAEQLLIEFANK